MRTHLAVEGRVVDDTGRESKGVESETEEDIVNDERKSNDEKMGYLYH
jgi:hypothetical protein